MNMKASLVVANFKMKLATKFDIENWIKNFSKVLEKENLKKTEVVLCPPALFFEKFFSLTTKKEISLGAQNCFWEDQGSFTGEISPKMLRSMDVDFVILGHSERRDFFKENNQDVAKKTEKALKNRLRPIICIGESQEEKKNEVTMEVILNQMNEILENVGRGSIEKVVLCYEPAWAISSNNPERTPTVNEIMEARLLMKRFLVKKYGELVAERIPIIYGGSVDEKNIKETCLSSGMDGALVGSTSVKPYDFVKIVKEFEN